MRRLATLGLLTMLAALVSLCAPQTARAQTTVTATVSDPAGNAYFPATIVAQSVVTAGQLSTSTSPIASTSGGLFTLTLPAATYVFGVCGQPTNLPKTDPTANPTPTQVCFQSTPIVISGGSQDISTQLNAIALNLGPPTGLALNKANTWTAPQTYAPPTNGTTGIICTPFSASFTAPCLLTSVGTCTPIAPYMFEFCFGASTGGVLGLTTTDNTNNVQLIAWRNTNRPTATCTNTILNVGNLDFNCTDSGVNDDLRLGAGSLGYKGKANSTVVFNDLDNVNNGITINVTPGIVTRYAGTTLIAGGMSALVAKSNLTTQSAAIAATTIYAVPAGKNGLYELHYRAAITTAATTSSSLGGSNGFQIRYTDQNDSVVKTSNPTTATVSAANTTTTTISGVLEANCAASTNLQFLMDYTSVGGTAMAYDLDVYVEYLGN